jgi:hypothetical protein
MIAKKAKTHRVTGPEVPLNFCPANSKFKFPPVTTSNVRTIANAIAAEYVTTPYKAKLGWIGELKNSRKPIITVVPSETQAKTNKMTLIHQL